MKVYSHKLRIPGILPENVIKNPAVIQILRNRNFQIICEELYQDVKKAIGELSKELQAAAKLHLIEGFSEKEVAQQLGITSVACRARISRARKRLKQSLGPKYGL